nr:helix-turn-helix domain-containing protein [Rhodococcus sp. Eu-32]
MGRAQPRGTIPNGDPRAGAVSAVGAEYAKGTRITGDSRDRLRAMLVDRYASGASIRSLAEQTGRSYGFVHKVLAESDTPLRTRGGPNRRKSARPN